MKRKRYTDDTGWMNHLMEELREYELRTPMSEEERIALHEWVSKGNSVHENSSLAEYENGEPVDFLEDYRYDMGIRKELAQLDERARENYIARLQGRDTIDNLREDLENADLRLRACSAVLERHGLMAEVEHQLESWKHESERIAKMYDERGFGEELPFE
jgi:hypothetical protein